MPYEIRFDFRDGDTICAEGESLVAAVMLAHEAANSLCDAVSAIQIISMETGEIVYSININLRVEVEFEVDNPYNL